MGDPAQPLEGAFLRALDSGPVKNLLNPVTKHVGDTLGYIGDIVRFYSHDNLVRIFRKWAESERAGKSLEEDEFKRVMPLLPLAAQVSDDELQNRWAALLETAACGDESFLPSFGHTLSQLTAEQARYIAHYYKVVTHPHTNNPRMHNGINFLYEVYDPNIVIGIGQFEMDLFPDGLSEKRVAEIQHWRHAQLIIQDLERLGIFSVEAVQQSGGKWMRYHLSEYGISFIQAVSIPKHDRHARSSK